MPAELYCELSKICAYAHLELDSFHTLVQQMFEIEYSVSPHSALDIQLERQKYLTKLYETARSQSIKDITQIYQTASNNHTENSDEMLIKACYEIMKQLSEFYTTSLPLHIAKIADLIEHPQPLPRNVLSEFLTITEFIQKKLKQYY